ncbi:insulinase family protein [Alteromonas sp. RKMC-009]|uniref:insulinase family protein n=1 Tax=Alteromonas sp. RKMC-009 TaxID=2267264 RepID=UPI000E6902A3|nr:insulinase family protein [Alteromonas sp. RKMC-009]AYA64116.1 insulinase family protein [Alteromonas sp. RKMC-009]
MRCLKIWGLVIACLTSWALTASVETVSAEPVPAKYSSSVTSAVQLQPANGEVFNSVAQGAITFTLENGLNVVMLPMNTTAAVTLHLQFDTNRYPDKPLPGLPALVFDVLAANPALSDFNGDLRLVSGARTSQVSVDTSGEKAVEAVNVLAQAVRYNGIDEDILARTKAEHWRNYEIAGLQKATGIEAGNLSRGTVQPEAALFLNITGDDIRNYVTDTLVASRARLFVAGYFMPDKMEQAIRQAFAGMPAGNAGASAGENRYAGYTLVHREVATPASRLTAAFAPEKRLTAEDKTASSFVLPQHQRGELINQLANLYAFDLQERSLTQYISYIHQRSVVRSGNTVERNPMADSLSSGNGKPEYQTQDDKPDAEKFKSDNRLPVL